jgi:hypothetical protein
MERKMTEQFTQCFRCELNWNADNIAGENRRGFPICEDCAERYDYHYAECCECLVINYNHYWERCARCAESLHSCEDCGDHFDMDWGGGGYSEYRDAYLCDGCYSEGLPGVRAYHSGHPKGLRFIGDGPTFFGVEFELAGENDVADILRDLEDSHCAHAEMDSSVMGLELISQPATLAEWRGDYGRIMRKALEKLWWQGYSADDSDCGAHVHVSREAFDSPAHIARFTAFFSLNREDMTELSGREYGLESYAYCGTPSPRAIISGAKRAIIGRERAHLRRMSAVNLTNPNTVEVRIWAGTDKWSETIGALEFLSALIAYTRDAHPAEFRNLGSLHSPSFVEWVSITPEWWRAHHFWRSRVAA